MIPTAAPDYLKWIIVEIMTILVGKLNNEDILAGHSVCLNNNLIFSMFNLAVTITASTVLARAVAEGNIAKSKNIMKLNLAICVFICILVSLLAFSLEGVFIKFFTVGEDMENAFKTAYRIMIYLVFIGDFFSTNFSIFLKSFGK